MFVGAGAGAGPLPGSESVLHRGHCDHTAACATYDVPRGLAEPSRPCRVRDLPTQVDQLLDPPDEVAGGEVALGEHLAQVVTLRPSVRRPRQPGVRGTEEVQPMVALDLRELAPEALEV